MQLPVVISSSNELENVPARERSMQLKNIKWNERQHEYRRCESSRGQFGKGETKGEPREIVHFKEVSG
jgi:hypothetical protein